MFSRKPSGLEISTSFPSGIELSSALTVRVNLTCLIRKCTGERETQTHIKEKVDGGGMRRGRSVYLKKGGLRPVLFIHAAGFANGHNYTLHVGGHHRLPGEAGAMSNKTTGSRDDSEQSHPLFYVLGGHEQQRVPTLAHASLSKPMHGLERGRR